MVEHRFWTPVKRPAALTYSGISPEAALAELHALVDLHDRGLWNRYRQW
ncbi:hypothetical protein [Ornithinimicrobium sp. INDO-MA30-4]|nr:hypothetical protein [Ornithinimicrobium sp. INDO-MA30-4]UJH71713.1 hypothetical protein L0A91_05570 [Ornithinimicrobium sp. INDO-MA30-4]